MYDIGYMTDYIHPILYILYLSFFTQLCCKKLGFTKESLPKALYFCACS